MIEIRYIKDTGEITGLCEDVEQFGHLDRKRDTEAITILDTPIPDKPIYAFLLNAKKNILEVNPNYVELSKPVDLAAELAELKAKLIAAKLIT